MEKFVDIHADFGVRADDGLAGNVQPRHDVRLGLLKRQLTGQEQEGGIETDHRRLLHGTLAGIRDLFPQIRLFA